MALHNGTAHSCTIVSLAVSIPAQYSRPGTGLVLSNLKAFADALGFEGICLRLCLSIHLHSIAQVLLQCTIWLTVCL